jgi:hypothetical protein
MCLCPPAGLTRHTFMQMNMLPIRTLVVFCSVILTACGPSDEERAVVAADQAAAAAAADTSWTLRFNGIGPLRVGMTFDEAKAALGGDLRMSDPIVRTAPDADRCDHPRSGRLPEGVYLMIEGQNLVRVEVDSSDIPTADGARIGDTEARIQQLYPGRVTVQPHKYTDGHYLVVTPAVRSDTTNLMIFETDGRVVERFRAGQRPQVEYVALPPARAMGG